MLPDKVRLPEESAIPAAPLTTPEISPLLLLKVNTPLAGNTTLPAPLKEVRLSPRVPLRSNEPAFKTPLVA